jgi:tetratricopeptide (TPR) repeat protein
MMNDLAQTSINAGIRNPKLIEAALAINEDRLHEAEPVLRAHLKANPLDVAAIRLMAQLAARIGRYKDSEALLRRALELAPGFVAARSNLAFVLYRQNRVEDAIAVMEQVLSDDNEDHASRNLMAAALGRVGEYDEALALYVTLLERFPDHARMWMSNAHLLKTVGKQDEGIAAYRRAIALEPTLGEAWWSLANLKTVKFDDADITAMEAALSGVRLAEANRLHLHFALGKAYDDHQNPPIAFEHYAKGNALRYAQQGYDASAITALVDRIIAKFPANFFNARRDTGHSSNAPIFILGMPRAGSTLIEQILASHSQIEGTMELPDLPAMAMREGGDDITAWVDTVPKMDAARLDELGAEYIVRTVIQRKTDKPYFIDKLPNNWLYIGLIQLILPNAKIIDARRHPLDCCFSNFRQHFAKGQAFSYDLADMGRYYADYVRLMAHFDAVLPRRVHRVIHETLVDNPEQEVRALLAYLDVDFEEACLNFHQNARAVRTASSEQVRRPLNRDGMDQWQRYDQWLGPLKNALSGIWERYPSI